MNRCSSILDLSEVRRNGSELHYPEEEELHCFEEVEQSSGMKEEAQSWVEEEQMVEERSWQRAEAEELVEELRRPQEELRKLHQVPELRRGVAAAESSGGCCCHSPFLAAAVDCCWCCCWRIALQCPGKDAATAAGYFPLSMLCSSWSNSSSLYHLYLFVYISMDLIDWNILVGRLYKTVASSLHPGSFNQEDDETVDDEHFHPRYDVTALCDYSRCDWPAA